MSIPRLKSMSVAFRDSQNKESIFNTASNALLNLLGPCTPSVMGSSPQGSLVCERVPVLFSRPGAPCSIVPSPTCHPPEHLSDLRANCSSEESFLPVTCSSLYTLLAPDVFSLNILKIYNSIFIFMFDFYIFYLFLVCLHH